VSEATRGIARPPPRYAICEPLFHCRKVCRQGGTRSGMAARDPLLRPHFDQICTSFVFTTGRCAPCLRHVPAAPLLASSPTRNAQSSLH